MNLGNLTLIVIELAKTLKCIQNPRIFSFFQTRFKDKGTELAEDQITQVNTIMGSIPGKGHFRIGVL